MVSNRELVAHGRRERYIHPAWAWTAAETYQ